MIFNLLNERGYKKTETTKRLDDNTIAIGLTFVKPGFETEYFAFEVIVFEKNNELKYCVSVPLKNSIYQFKTTFNNNCDAMNFLESKFLDFID